MNSNSSAQLSRELVRNPVRRGSVNSALEDMIYDKAVPEKRVSSSSEDPDTGDEFLHLDFNNLQMVQGITVLADEVRDQRRGTNNKTKSRASHER